MLQQYLAAPFESSNCPESDLPLSQVCCVGPAPGAGADAGLDVVSIGVSLESDRCAVHAGGRDVSRTSQQVRFVQPH